LCKQFPDLCLIVAPRQIERSASLLTAMQQVGLNPVLRTKVDASTGPVRHLILDTMGELANVYAVATFAFVGNSFDPVVKGGGQNLLQPLAHGKPVLFGPRIATIRSEAELVLEAGVGFQVANGAELAEKAARLLGDNDLVMCIQTDALALIAGNRGVSARYAGNVAEACRISHGPPKNSDSGSAVEVGQR
jgi:3-deoxy-D-manno-octulosonic-acid transferase